MKSVATIKLKIPRRDELVETMRQYSKACSKCGSLHTSRTKSFFRCIHCGYSLNADLNASLNLANRHSMTDAGSGAVSHPHLTHDDAEASSDGLRQSAVKSHPL